MAVCLFIANNVYCCIWKSLSGMYAKLRTVAASNNRVHALQSLYYCLFEPRIHIVVLRTHPFAVNHTFNTTPPERLQQYYDNKLPNIEIAAISKILAHKS